MRPTNCDMISCCDVVSWIGGILQHVSLSFVQSFGLGEGRGGVMYATCYLQFSLPHIPQRKYRVAPGMNVTLKRGKMGE